MDESWATADDGTRLWCGVLAQRGAAGGPTLVLTHGGPGLDDDLSPLADLVTPHATVVLWHQRGVGRSDPVGPHTLARYVADIEAVRRHVGVERWIAGGHSFGATLALHHAIAHPDRTLGLVDVAGVGTGWAWRDEANATADAVLTPAQRERRDELVRRRRTDDEEVEWRALHWLPDLAEPDRDHALAQATALAAATGPICWEANRTLAAEARGGDEEALLDRCRRLDVPALLLHGAADPRPAWALDRLAAALPRAVVEVVPHAGHRPWVEAPGAVADALARLVRQVVDARAAAPRF